MHTAVEDSPASRHSYVTNRHRKTEQRVVGVVEGAPLSLEDLGRQRFGERRRKNGKEWASEQADRSRSTVESKVCRGLFTDSSSLPWVCPVQPIVRFFPSIIFLLFPSFFSYRAGVVSSSVSPSIVTLILSLSSFFPPLSTHYA